MLNLRPEATAKGASYLWVLLRAEKEVDRKELGIGARIIEIPGSTRADKVDALAARLKSALEGEVEVSRPVKFTDLRVTGLYDATNADRLVVAVAQEGDCTEAQVRVRNVRPGPRGTGSDLLEVPAAAAKKLLQLGNISVGWNQVRLSYMEAQPKYCFKCLGMGHVAAACPSPKDRSGLCYPCGSCTPHHSAGAQDFFLQSMLEWAVDVAGPYCVPAQPHCCESPASSGRSLLPGSPPFSEGVSPVFARTGQSLVYPVADKSGLE
nr:uncharacterized protein LOC116765749 [Danaus plexippus plexippus]